MIKILILTGIGGLSFLFGSIFGETKEPIKEKVIQEAVIGILNQYHYEPEDINDEFSAQAYDFFLKYIDSRKRFFTQEDLATLEAYKLLIDDEVHSGSFEFFDLAVDLLQKRIDQIEEIYTRNLEQTFDFTVDETFEFDPEKYEWAKNDAALENKWRQQLKYDVLVSLSSSLTKQDKARADKLNISKEPSGALDEKSDEDTGQEDAASNQENTDDELLSKSMAQLEEEARATVLEDYEKWYKNFKKIRRSDRFEAYLNTFAHMFDPHTDYFNPKEKEDFDISMGGKLEGIGARLRTEGDLTKVVSIVPGGPVYKSEQIDVNDYILKVTQKGEEPLDIFGMRIDDVVSQIRGKKGTFVSLAIQKKDGSIIEVELERDVINIEESFAKSAIINLEGTIDNVGYIDLPKFYSSFEGPEGNSCASDVAKEIKKLRANNVSGIILDLRNNGGGSLKDVVDMSGLFIEDGPIVQVKPRARRPYIYKDEDESVQYDGPLIVMINSFSASASEILAAAMQDYDRAIIVGSQSFGKGTVQRFIDLDKAVKGSSVYKPLGQLKLTMQKFYRVDGGSTQLKGVTPDVFLPDRYRLLDVGEREYPNAMDWSQLSRLDFGQEVYKVPNKQYLNKSSEQRITNSEVFASIYEQGKWYKENKDKTSYSLNLDVHRAYLKHKQEQADKFKNVMADKIEKLSIINLPEDLDAVNANETSIARNDNWVKNLNKDIYIEESLAIMRDMIHGVDITSISDKKE